MPQLRSAANFVFAPADWPISHASMQVLFVGSQFCAQARMKSHAPKHAKISGPQSFPSAQFTQLLQSVGLPQVPEEFAPVVVVLVGPTPVVVGPISVVLVVGPIPVVDVGPMLVVPVDGLPVVSVWLWLTCVELATTEDDIAADDEEACDALDDEDALTALLSAEEALDALDALDGADASLDAEPASMPVAVLAGAPVVVEPSPTLM